MCALILLEMKKQEGHGSKDTQANAQAIARDVMTVFEHVNWNQGVGCPKNQRGLLSALSSRLLLLSLVVGGMAPSQPEIWDQP